MDLDGVLLSRLQFALTIMFHYIFPPLTIGMGIVLAYLEGMYHWIKEEIYEVAAKFWVTIFAVNFALGVASGIVMELQFGMKWATYSRFVGDVFGSALAAEGIFAFFLESVFLAVLAIANIPRCPCTRGEWARPLPPAAWRSSSSCVCSRPRCSPISSPARPGPSAVSPSTPPPARPQR